MEDVQSIRETTYTLWYAICQPYSLHGCSGVNVYLYNNIFGSDEIFTGRKYYNGLLQVLYGLANEITIFLIAIVLYAI